MSDVRSDELYEKAELGATSKDSVMETTRRDLQSETLFGLPLKYVSLLTLAVVNTLLTIVMRYSRTLAPASQTYSAATAVLFTDIVKGGISFATVLSRNRSVVKPPGELTMNGHIRASPGEQIFTPDCWKLSIPAVLYVLQHNLQYLAISNLEVPTYQVTYQMKILTTAAFSVVLLRKEISSSKWLSLFFLAIGVAIVQLQADQDVSPSSSQGATPTLRVAHPLLGFLAVCAACVTSGLGGVYFEMVLKNSKTDLWVRNVQMAIFSLVPDLVLAVMSARGTEQDLISALFSNFGLSAWAAVLMQVANGLVIALVIKHADNILKAFATSLSIVLSFIISIILFSSHITSAFLLGASIVVISTWMYSRAAAPKKNVTEAFNVRSPGSPKYIIRIPSSGGSSHSRSASVRWTASISKPSF